jgi:hypothetical protein
VQPLQPEDPSLIGKYQLLARLGSGGMGRVYLGRSPGGRLVAIKLVRPELAESAEFRKRFAREVDAARTVGGMYTATVVDADPGARAPWLVTAYIDGSSPADAVAAHGPLPVTSVLHLAAGLAEGLCAIHAAGLVHRDRNPARRDFPVLIRRGSGRRAFTHGRRPGLLRGDQPARLAGGLAARRRQSEPGLRPDGRPPPGDVPGRHHQHLGQRRHRVGDG